ncbi:MAG: beta-propeller domain-containing protein [Bacillota bacterium]|nr:beta-propeller domain-containing protein [Bacillota bacterium]HHU43710.1 hypothetical protein [Clostridiales bacterium]
MDEYEGFLRVATTVSDREIYNNLFILDSQLSKGD